MSLPPYWWGSDTPDGDTGPLADAAADIARGYHAEAVCVVVVATAHGVEIAATHPYGHGFRERMARLMNGVWPADDGIPTDLLASEYRRRFAWQDVRGEG